MSSYVCGDQDVVIVKGESLTYALKAGESVCLWCVLLECHEGYDGCKWTKYLEGARKITDWWMATDAHSDVGAKGGTG